MKTNKFNIGQEVIYSNSKSYYNQRIFIIVGIEMVSDSIFYKLGGSDDKEPYGFELECVAEHLLSTANFSKIPSECEFCYSVDVRVYENVDLFSLMPNPKTYYQVRCGNCGKTLSVYEGK